MAFLSSIDPRSEAFRNNTASMAALVADLRKTAARAALGGG